MIALDMAQGSPEWLEARLGVPTASCFDKLITPTGKSSTQADGYANTLIAEWLSGASAGADLSGNQWVQRGNELEPQARAYYEFQTDCSVQQIGFVLRDDRQVGCSPDGLVTDVGLVEIKCPAPHTHVGYLLSGEAPAQYRPQVQGQMWITERNWCDFLSFHPLMPPVLVRVERDDKYIKTLSVEVEKLLELMATRKAALMERGITPIKETA